MTVDLVLCMHVAKVRLEVEKFLCVCTYVIKICDATSAARAVAQPYRSGYSWILLQLRAVPGE